MSKKTDLRKFRSDWAKLKKAGVVSSVSDARKITPTRANLKTIRKFEDVLAGRAYPVKISNKEIRALKEAGHKIREARPKGQPRVALVRKDPTEKVRVTRTGHVKTILPSGITRVSIPIKYQDLENYLTSIAADSEAIDAMKANNEVFGFQFFGSRSYSTYTHIEDLIEDLLLYESVENSVELGNAKSMKEQYQNLEIFHFPRGTPWRGDTPPRKRSTASRKRAKEREREKFSSLPASKQEAQRKAQAARMRKYRAEMKKNNPAKYKATIKRNQKRAKKSRGF